MLDTARHDEGTWTSNLQSVDALGRPCARYQYPSLLTGHDWRLWLFYSKLFLAGVVGKHHTEVKSQCTLDKSFGVARCSYGAAYGIVEAGVMHSEYRMLGVVSTASG